MIFLQLCLWLHDVYSLLMLLKVACKLQNTNLVVQFVAHRLILKCEFVLIWKSSSGFYLKPLSHFETICCFLQELSPLWLIRCFSWRSCGPTHFQEKTLLPTPSSITTRWCFYLSSSSYGPVSVRVLHEFILFLSVKCGRQCQQVVTLIKAKPLLWSEVFEKLGLETNWQLLLKAPQLENVFKKQPQLPLPLDVAASWFYFVD